MSVVRIKHSTALRRMRYTSGRSCSNQRLHNQTAGIHLTNPGGLSKQPEPPLSRARLGVDVACWAFIVEDSHLYSLPASRRTGLTTRFCVTVDLDSLEDNSVTVRERDSMRQERINAAQLEGYLAERQDPPSLRRA
jgi:hypothetical protein